MIKPILTFVGKFVPGVNSILAGYTIYQMGEAAVKVIDAFYYGNSAPAPAPIPVVKASDMSGSLNLISGIATGASVLTTVNQLMKASESDRLDKYKEEMGNTVEKLKEDIKKVDGKMEKDVKDLKKTALTEKAFQTIQKIVMLYLDEYIRIFPRYEGSFRNVKLLLATNDNDYEGIVKVFEVLDNGPTNSLEHFVDVVLFDKICKATGEDGFQVDAIEFMEKGLLDKKNKLIENMKRYDEYIEREYQKMNEKYMESYVWLTNHISKLREDEDIGEKEIKHWEEEYEKIWDKRPFKGVVPDEEYQTEDYQRFKEEIKKVDKEIRLLKAGNVVDYGAKNRKLYEESFVLSREIKDNNEYKRIFGSEKPENVDLSKGKVSMDLAKKIVRIKDILEENKYNVMEDKVWNGDEQIITGGSGNIRLPNPVKIVDRRDRYSVMRAYNQKVSGEFIEKNKRILMDGPMSFEELDRRMDERARERRKEENDLTRSLNESWERLNKFDEEHKRKNAFVNKVRNYGIGLLLGGAGVYLLGQWMSKPSIVGNPLIDGKDVVVVRSYLQNVGRYFVYGAFIVIGIAILPYSIGFLSLLVELVVGSLKRTGKMLRDMIEKDDEQE